jgi:hypothetical protein
MDEVVVATAAAKVVPAPMPRAHASSPAKPPMVHAATPFAAAGAGPAGMPVAAAAVPAPVVPPGKHMPRLWLDVALIGTAIGLLIGSPLGWLARWLVAGILHVFRFLKDIGAPVKSSSLWIEKTSVIIGLLVCGVAVWVAISARADSTASRHRLTTSRIHASTPIFWRAFPLIAWLSVACFLLLNYAPNWREQALAELRQSPPQTLVANPESSPKLPSPTRDLAAKDGKPDTNTFTYQTVPSETREHQRERLLNKAIQYCEQGCLPAAEEQFQKLFAAGFNDTQTQKERDNRYYVTPVAITDQWSSKIRIDEKFVEIVADGPFEIANADLTSSGAFDFKGRKQLDLGIRDVRFRSITRGRHVTIYIGGSSRTPFFTEPFGHLRARKKPVIITIIRPGGAASAVTSPPGPLLPGDATSTSSADESTRSAIRKEESRPTGMITTLPAAQPTSSSQTRMAPMLCYRARISRRDQLNSKGRDLTGIPAIKLQDFLQQDRYNILRRGAIDPDDESPAKNYEWLAAEFLNPLTSDTSPKCLQAVLEGEPLLEVTLFPEAVGVRLIQP